MSKMKDWAQDMATDLVDLQDVLVDVLPRLEERDAARLRPFLIARWPAARIIVDAANGVTSDGR